MNFKIGFIGMIFAMTLCAMEEQKLQLPHRPPSFLKKYVFPIEKDGFAVEREEIDNANPLSPRLSPQQQAVGIVLEHSDKARREVFKENYSKKTQCCGAICCLITVAGTIYGIWYGINS